MRSLVDREEALLEKSVHLAKPYEKSGQLHNRKQATPAMALETRMPRTSSTRVATDLGAT